MSRIFCTVDLISPPTESLGANKHGGVCYGKLTFTFVAPCLNSGAVLLP